MGGETKGRQPHSSWVEKTHVGHSIVRANKCVKNLSHAENQHTSNLLIEEYDAPQMKQKIITHMFDLVYFNFKIHIKRRFKIFHTCTIQTYRSGNHT